MSVWNVYLKCIQQPLVIFVLAFISAYFWFPSIELSIAAALLATIIIKLLFEVLSHKEQFCSMHRNRWCPEKDVCYVDVSKEKATIDFLDNTDRFIKELYDFSKPDDPAYAISHHSRDQ
jgi:hypothetical protein